MTSDRIRRRLFIRIVFISTLVMAVMPTASVGSCEIVFDRFAYRTALDWIEVFWYSLPFTIPCAVLFALLAQWVYHRERLPLIGYLFAMLIAGFVFYVLVLLILPLYGDVERTEAMLFAGIEVSILAGSTITYELNEKYKRERKMTGPQE